MAVGLAGMENLQELEVAVTGPGNANRMFVYAGTAVCSFRGTGGNWHHDSLTFSVGRSFSQGQFHRAVVTASLASIANEGVATNAGWAVDWVDADWDDEGGQVHVTARLAVRDTDGFLLRIAFQVTVLAEISS